MLQVLVRKWSSMKMLKLVKGKFLSSNIGHFRLMKNAIGAELKTSRRTANLPQVRPRISREVVNYKLGKKSDGL